MTQRRQSILRDVGRAGIVATSSLIVLLLPGNLRAQGAETRPAGVTDSAIARGAKVYRGSAACVECHGPAGGGTLKGPSLTDGTWLRGHGTYDELIQQVVHGVPRLESVTGEPMPMRGWSGATDDEIRAVAAYVWSLSHRRGKAPS